MADNVLYVPVKRELELNGYNLLDAMEIGWSVADNRVDDIEYIVAVTGGTQIAVGKVMAWAKAFDKNWKTADKKDSDKCAYWFKLYLLGDPRLTDADAKTMRKLMQGIGKVAGYPDKSLDNLQNCAFGAI